jgi:acyl carrier protein
VTVSDVITDLEQLFREVLDDDRIALRPELRPDDLAEWDSLAHVRLVASIEEHFDISFSIDEITPPETVADLVALIESKRR